MTKLILTGLVVLNVLLAAGVYLRQEPKAQAAIGTPIHDYSAVAGNSGGTSYIYLMEATQGVVVSIRTDAVNGQLRTAGSANVGNDLKR
jgi:hypothetical protein